MPAVSSQSPKTLPKQMRFSGMYIHHQGTRQIDVIDHSRLAVDNRRFLQKIDSAFDTFEFDKSITPDRFIESMGLSPEDIEIKHPTKKVTVPNIHVQVVDDTHPQIKPDEFCFKTPDGDCFTAFIPELNELSQRITSGKLHDLAKLNSSFIQIIANLSIFLNQKYIQTSEIIEESDGSFWQKFVPNSAYTEPHDNSTSDRRAINFFKQHFYELVEFISSSQHTLTKKDAQGNDTDVNHIHLTPGKKSFKNAGNGA